MEDNTEDIQVPNDDKIFEEEEDKRWYPYSPYSDWYA